jgi:hypothetical protein
MFGAGIKKAGIRYDTEGFLAKAVKFFIHRFFTDYKRNQYSEIQAQGVRLKARDILFSKSLPCTLCR